MSLSGIILGIIDVAIVAAILLLVGMLIKWFMQWIFNTSIPTEIERLYVGIVALICLYMIVALLFGLPLPLRVIHGDAASAPQLAATPSIIAPER